MEEILKKSNIEQEQANAPNKRKREMESEFTEQEKQQIKEEAAQIKAEAEQIKAEAQEINAEAKEIKAETKANYLLDLQRVQAEFINYKKRTETAIIDARQEGFMNAIENFLPALDSFKMATDMITDKNTLMGIKFIEKGILDTLSKMGVELINTSGKFDPTLHQAIDTDSSADVESGTIVKTAYNGFTYKGKVIRYAQVVVKK